MKRNVAALPRPTPGCSGGSRLRHRNGCAPACVVVRTRVRALPAPVQHWARIEEYVWEEGKGKDASVQGVICTSQTQRAVRAPCRYRALALSLCSTHTHATNTHTRARALDVSVGTPHTHTLSSLLLSSSKFSVVSLMRSRRVRGFLVKGQVFLGSSRSTLHHVS